MEKSVLKILYIVWCRFYKRICSCKSSEGCTLRCSYSVSQCWDYILIIMFIICSLGFLKFPTVSIHCSVNNLNHPKKWFLKRSQGFVLGRNQQDKIIRITLNFSVSKSLEKVWVSWRTKHSSRVRWPLWGIGSDHWLGCKPQPLPSKAVILR